MYREDNEDVKITMTNKKWILMCKEHQADDVMRRSQELSVPPIIATILMNRGIQEPKQFLEPNEDGFIDPFLMRGMEQAVARILKACESNEKIAVYGDYDVDGITSTAIMVKFLRAHKADVIYYIPDRLEEGYGINMDAIDKIAASGVTLLITVDCGITAVNEIAYATRKGIDTIITDHHECKDEMPDAYCILNPKQPSCPYPFKKLAGVGVAFKLLQALTIQMRFHMRELIEEYIDLVAIGTVADVMPLVGENRIIVKKGLELLSFTQNRGVRALAERADINLSNVQTGTIGFMLAPRINAAGRMGEPRCAVELLLATDDMTARKYAEKLDDENRERQETEISILEEALQMMEDNSNYKDDYVLVLAHENWHHGIIGIVASKLSERFNKPCILISTDEHTGKGSGRSIHSFNLFKALEFCQELLHKFGGHDLAAGLSIAPDQIDDFRKKINLYAKKSLTEEDFIPLLYIDSELPAPYINMNTAERFSVLEPYGMGNASPVFFARKMTVVQIRPLSDGKHLKLTLRSGEYHVDAVGFNMGNLCKEIKINDLVDIAFNLDINIYRGMRQLQVLLKDIKFSVTDK